MSEFISLKEAIATVKEAYENDELFDGYEYRLNELPSTEIIHCRECKFWNPNIRECEGVGNWFGFEDAWSENGFCYKAERKTDG